MSVHAVSWVLQNSDERLGNRLVLIVLADHAHSDGSNAFPSVKTIAQEARMSERNVRYVLRDMEKRGSICPIGKHRSGATIYSVVGVQILQGVQDHAENVSDFAPEPSSKHQEAFLGGNICSHCGVKPRGKSMAHHLLDVHGIEVKAA